MGGGGRGVGVVPAVGMGWGVGGRWAAAGVGRGVERSGHGASSGVAVLSAKVVESVAPAVAEEGAMAMGREEGGVIATKAGRGMSGKSEKDTTR